VAANIIVSNPSLLNLRQTQRSQKHLNSAHFTQCLASLGRCLSFLAQTKSATTSGSVVWSLQSSLTFRDSVGFACRVLTVLERESGRSWPFFQLYTPAFFTCSSTSEWGSTIPPLNVLALLTALPKLPAQSIIIVKMGASIRQSWSCSNACFFTYTYCPWTLLVVSRFNGCVFPAKSGMYCQ